MPRRLASLTASTIAVGLLLTGIAARAQLNPNAPGESDVSWFFAYKFNTRAFPQCPDGAERACPFGGSPVTYKSGFGQQHVVASNKSPDLRTAGGCLGDTDVDPVGATFQSIYDGALNYVVWNDQFYNDPKITGCGTSCAAPWGHSKGVLAWDNQGNGVVLQVSTPSWPAAGTKLKPRPTDGNTLGCVSDNNVLVAQSFFSLGLTPADTLVVARALANSSVVTDPKIRRSSRTVARPKSPRWSPGSASNRRPSR